MTKRRAGIHVSMVVVALMIASACGLAGPGAASASPTEPATIVPDAPGQTRWLQAEYGLERDGTHWRTLSATVTSLTFALPDEFRQFALDTVHADVSTRTYYFEGDPEVDKSTNSITISFPAGALSAKPDPTDPWAPTLSRMHWSIGAQAGEHPTETLDLKGNLSIVAGDGSTAATVPLTAGAATYGPLLRQEFSAHGPSGEAPEWLTNGQPITAEAPEGMTWDTGSRGIAITENAGYFVFRGATSADGSSLSLAATSGDFETLTTAQAYARLDVTSADGVGSMQPRILVHAPVVFARPTGEPGVLSARIFGPDRYRGAAAIADAEALLADSTWESGTLYLASGQNFPDALSVGALAARADSRLLLLPRDVDPSLDDIVSSHLYHRVVIVGGENSISPAWESHLRELSFDEPEIERVSGADRYAVSRSLALSSHPDGATSVFLATGASYPDALAAVPAAAATDSPVLLVPGSAAQLDAATLDTLDRLGATQVTLLGGTASISAGIEAQLGDVLPAAEVTRIGGADRFALAANVSRHFADDLPGTESGAPEVFLASGAAFADALAGGVLAGRHAAPILLSQATCIPAASNDELEVRETKHVTLLGGPATLTGDVASLVACR